MTNLLKRINNLWRLSEYDLPVYGDKSTPLGIQEEIKRLFVKPQAQVIKRESTVEEFLKS